MQSRFAVTDDDIKAALAQIAISVDEIATALVASAVFVDEIATALVASAGYNVTFEIKISTSVTLFTQ